jgi:IclR family transcriptional regulator, KDG regulon repressor
VIYQSSLVKSMKILEMLVKNDELGISDIAKQMELNRSNVHRILNTFVSLRYVEKNPVNNKYRPSLLLFEFGNLIIQRNELIKIAHPFLEELSELGETVNLAILDHNEVVYVDRVQCPQPLRTDINVGWRVPAYCTGVGKVQLAGLNENKLSDFLRVQKLVKRTPNTITSERVLRAHLKEVREQGFAIDNEELNLGIRGIAAPVRNHLADVIAGISVAGPSTRVTFEKLENFKKPLLDIVLKISKRLGFKRDESDPGRS